MYKLNPKKFLIKEPTIYDIRGNASFEKRDHLLKTVLYLQPKFTVRGGTSKTNPYKIHYDVVLAERRDELEKFKNSLLWSPRYTPWHFKFLFLYPAFFVGFLMFYIRYIAIPKRMLYLKKKYGIVSPELEEKGWLKDWEDEEDDEELDDPFKEIYTGWTLKEVEDFEKKAEKMKQKMGESDKPPTKTLDSLSAIRSFELHNKLQDKFEKIYNTKQKLGHEIP